MDGLTLANLPGGQQPTETASSSSSSGSPGSRRSSGDRQRRRRRRRVRALVVLVIALLVIGGGVIAVTAPLRELAQQVTEPDDYPGPGAGAAEVTVAEGATGREIAAELAGANVVKTPRAFSTVAQSDPRAATIKPGTYALKQEMSAKGALAALLDPASLQQHTFTVPEGFTSLKALQVVAEVTGTSVEELRATVADPGVGLPPEAEGNLEGWLFPATYAFPLDTTSAEIVTAMVKRTVQALDQAGVPADQREEVLTKASLIQAEAGPSDDMAKVSRVIDNRLSSGMMLQFDTTVNYATGKTGLTTTDEDRANASPYNTYKVAGLPPGPISNPGDDAIDAAMNPVDGPWLFFVVTNPDTGETAFSTTKEEHDANVKVFQAWARANPGS